MPNKILLAILAILMTVLLLLVLTMVVITVVVMGMIVGHLMAWTNRVKSLVVQDNPLAWSTSIPCVSPRSA